MKKSTYRILRAIPIVGSFVQNVVDPAGVFCSPAKESGLYDEVIGLYNEYSKIHPGKQLTKRLVNKLLRENNKP